MNNNVGVVEVMDFESMVLSSSTKKRKILQNNYEGLLKPVSQENNQNDVLSLFGQHEKELSFLVTSSLRLGPCNGNQLMKHRSQWFQASRRRRRICKHCSPETLSGSLKF